MKQNFKEKTASAEKQISDGEVELADGQAEYDSALKDYNDAQANYGDLLVALTDAVAALNQIDSNSTSQIANLQERLDTDTTLTNVQRADLLEQQASLMEKSAISERGSHQGRLSQR